MRKFRALLFQIEKDGPKGKHWQGNTNVLAAIRGFAEFVHMVNPSRGAALRERVQNILDKNNTPKNTPQTPPQSSAPIPMEIELPRETPVAMEIEVPAEAPTTPNTNNDERDDDWFKVF